jgi:hemolysin activation/secretion protein
MKNTMQSTLLVAGLQLAGMFTSVAAWAQVAPDAGTSLELLRKQPQPLPQGPALSVPEREMATTLGGQAVQIRTVVLQGNTRLTTDSVLAAVQAAQATAQPLTIDGLRALAERVSAYYRDQGFPFARALVPVQDLKDGRLLIQVVEGQYGKVLAKSADAALADTAQGFLAELVAGNVIASPALERATLLIGDLPGVRVVPVMRPGARTGEGDLDAQVAQVQTTQASVSVDNHGSRYTGPYRVQFNGAINRVLTVGDQLSMTGIAPVQGLWVGSVNYGLPLGRDGLRAQIGVSRLHYKLREDFEGFNGQADVRSATLSYPVIRSRAQNLSASVAYQSKDLKDVGTFQTVNKKAGVVPLTLSFDQRDAVLGGGLTYGAMSAVSGQVNAGAADQSFSKWTLDVARIQPLGQGWSLYGRWFQQATSDNLDSSEKALLGGASGVRAYPSGEAAGDKARLLQAELRLNTGAWAPYLFYDYGKVKVDARAERVNLPSPDKTRSGAGLGLRYQDGPISWNAALAWRIQGGVPEADAKTSENPRIWVEMRYAF